MTNYLFYISVISVVVLCNSCVREHPNKEYYEWQEVYRINESGDTSYVNEDERYKFIVWYPDYQSDYFIEIFKGEQLACKSEFSFVTDFNGTGVCSENPAKIKSSNGLYIEMIDSRTKAEFSGVLFSGVANAPCFPRIVTKLMHQ